VKPLAVIQARLTSSRLPGKVLEEIGGTPALWHTYQRAVSVVPATVVVIPRNEANAELEAWCTDHEIPCLATSGNEDDVLARFAAAVRMFKPDIVVRLTADCPFVQPDMIERCIKMCGTVEYASNIFPLRTYPRGLDVEAMHADLLLQADGWAVAQHPDLVGTDNGGPPTSYDREHVTPWVRRHAKTLRLARHRDNLRKHRWTLDTPEDLAWFRRIAEVVDVTPPNPTLKQLVTLIRKDRTLGHFEPGTT
jgi:spore coat polysaccharide biosynthesis protein SpsF